LAGERSGGVVARFEQLESGKVIPIMKQHEIYDAQGNTGGR
jgi:hypothetical protein